MNSVGDRTQRVNDNSGFTTLKAIQFEDTARVQNELDSVIPKDLFRPVRLSNEGPLDFNKHVQPRRTQNQSMTDNMRKTGATAMLAETPQIDYEESEAASFTYGNNNHHKR